MADKKQDIHTAIMKVMGKIGVIGKEGQNTAQHYSYRSFQQVIETLSPIFKECGVYATSKVDNLTVGPPNPKGWKTTTCTMTFCLTAESDGSSVETTVIGQGTDPADKGGNKAMSTALKYAYGQLFMIPFEGDDPENSKSDASAPQNYGQNQPPQRQNNAPQQQQRQPAPQTNGGPDMSRQIITKFKPFTKQPLGDIAAAGFAELEDALGLANWRADNVKPGQYAEKNKAEAEGDVLALQAALKDVSGQPQGSQDQGGYDEYATNLPDDNEAPF